MPDANGIPRFKLNHHTEFKNGVVKRKLVCVFKNMNGKNMISDIHAGRYLTPELRKKYELDGYTASLAKRRGN